MLRARQQADTTLAAANDFSSHQFCGWYDPPDLIALPAANRGWTGCGADGGLRSPKDAPVTFACPARSTHPLPR
jgi:hypothetical protein